jgi:hypothetical protein
MKIPSSLKRKDHAGRGGLRHQKENPKQEKEHGGNRGNGKPDGVDHGNRHLQAFVLVEETDPPRPELTGSIIQPTAMIIQNSRRFGQYQMKKPPRAVRGGFQDISGGLDSCVRPARKRNVRG